jgi:putative FmdB family regulatory protein
MPLYQYMCSNCMKLLEFMVPLDRYDAKIKCPHCKRIVKRILSPVMFRIKSDG